MPSLPTVTNNSTIYGYLPQLCRAFRERLLAVGATSKASYYATPTGELPIFGTSSSKPVHLQMQEDLEYMAVRFINPTTSEPHAVFTIAEWQAASGLTSGYRRALTWTGTPALPPTFTHGHIEDGDVAGWWITSDIIDGLRGLGNQTKRASTTYYSSQRASGFMETQESDVTTARAALATLWDSATFYTTGGTSIFYGGENAAYDESEYLLACFLGRTKDGCGFATAAPVGGSVIMIGKWQSISGAVYHSPIGKLENEWDAYASGTFSASDTRWESSAWYPAWDDSTACPDGPWESLDDSYASYLKDRYALIEWDFTDT